MQMNNAQLRPLRCMIHQDTETKNVIWTNYHNRVRVFPLSLIWFRPPLLLQHLLLSIVHPAWSSVGKKSHLTVSSVHCVPQWVICCIVTFLFFSLWSPTSHYNTPIWVHDLISLRYITIPMFYQCPHLFTWTTPEKHLNWHIEYLSSVIYHLHRYNWQLYSS